MKITDRIRNDESVLRLIPMRALERGSSFLRKSAALLPEAFSRNDARYGEGAATNAVVLWDRRKSTEVVPIRSIELEPAELRMASDA
jgi:hypothetical protein